MKNILKLAFALAIVVYAMPVIACDSCQNNVFMGKKDAESVLQKEYPQLKYESFKDSPVTGLFEIVVDGNVIYYQPPKTFLFGEITRDGKSLTAERKDELIGEKLKKIDLKKAVKVGSGKTIVIEVTDPDCPFCRKATEFLEGKKELIEGITRYVLFMPLPFHQDAPKKAKYILCSSDPYRAYEDVYSGKLDGKDLSIPAGCNESNVEELLKEHQAIAGALGVRGTPTFFINGKRVDGADTNLIEKLIAGK